MSEDFTNRKIGAGAAKAKVQASPKDFGNPLKVTAFAVAVFIASQILAVVILALVLGAWRGTPAVEDLFNGSITGGFALILLTETITLFMVYKLIGAERSSWPKIGLIKPRWKDLPIAGAGFIAYYALLFTASIIIYSLLPGINTDQKQELGFDETDVTTNIQLLLTFVSLVILPPIGEEILMRGYLLSGLRARLKLFPSMMIVSLLFAAAHLQLGNGQAPLWAAAINTFFLSVTLVYVKEKTGSLWPCIYIHGLNNLVAFTYLFKDSLF